MDTERHTTRIAEVLERIKQQLSKAHVDEEFFETDLEQWKKKLDTMKKEIATPTIINIQSEEPMSSFISKVIFNVNALTNFFERTIGDVKIENDGTLIVHGQTSTQAAVRGRDEYSWGLHRFRFKIEHLGGVKWIFFGIISKDAPLEAQSYKTLSSYGWAGHNQVYINGVVNSGFGGYITALKVDDTLELLVDCDQKTIHLTNERARSRYSLNVAAAECSFPG